MSFHTLPTHIYIHTQAATLAPAYTPCTLYSCKSLVSSHNKIQIDFLKYFRLKVAICEPALVKPCHLINSPLMKFPLLSLSHFFQRQFFGNQFLSYPNESTNVTRAFMLRFNHIDAGSRCDFYMLQIVRFLSWPNGECMPSLNPVGPRL